MTGWDKLSRVEAYLDMQAHEAAKAEAFCGTLPDLREWYEAGNDFINDILDDIPLTYVPKEAK